MVAHTFSCIVWLIGILINKMLYQGSFELLFYSTVLLVSICQRSFVLEFIIHHSYFSGYEMNLHVYEFKTEVENNGFEPLTPCLQSRCSSQLS